MRWAVNGLIGLVVSLCLINSKTEAAKPDASQVGEHVIAVVPMVGSGTLSDPKRPLFFPTPQELTDAMAKGQPLFLSLRYVLADDGKRAIVEFVSPSRTSLKPILEAAIAGTVTAYEPRAVSLGALTQALKQVKADFDLASLRGISLKQPASMAAAQ